VPHKWDFPTGIIVGLLNRSVEIQRLYTLGLDVHIHAFENDIWRVWPTLVLHAPTCVTGEHDSELGCCLTFASLALLATHATHNEPSL
jgi:hypothetical protein